MEPIQLTPRIKTTKKYKTWREAVLYRDYETCQECGLKGFIQVHHKNRLIDIIKKNKIETVNDALLCEELWNLDNGICLCSCCHIEHHCQKIKKELLK